MKKEFRCGWQRKTPSSRIKETKEKLIVSDKPPQANLLKKKKNVICFSLKD